MMDFGLFTEEQREEWRRSEITASAIAMLRDAEAIAMKAVLGAAESGQSTAAISQTAGYRQGIEKAIDLLTRNHEKRSPQ